jgi:hypothetical protein
VSTIIYTALNYLWPPLGKGSGNGFEEIDYTDWEHGGRPLEDQIQTSSDSGSAIKVDGEVTRADLEEGYDDKKM